MQKHSTTASKSLYNTTLQTLNNGVKLAISKFAGTGKACISVSINKGHFDACKYPEGYAHLLEHMLFTPSVNYPHENALDQHLQACNGEVNAWTQDTNTQYQLICNAEGVVSACDIFMDRLSRPIFGLEHINSELAAIDAEFTLKQHEPARQLLSVQKATCSNMHPFSRFSSGNKQTLDCGSIEKTQHLLQTFHRHIMQSQNICICLALPDSQINNADITQMVSTIEQSFPASEPSLATILSPQLHTQYPALYLPQHLNQFISVKSSREQAQLVVSFCIDIPNNNAVDSLCVLLSHMLESKHEYGLYDNLLKSGNIVDLHSYYKTVDGQHYEFMVSFNLTEKGNTEAGYCIQAVLQYLAFLADKPIEYWRFREKSQQYNLQASLQSEAGSIEHALHMSQSLHQQSLKDALRPPAFLTEEAHTLCGQYISTFTRANCRVYFIANSVQGTHTTKHYHAHYSVQSLSNVLPVKPIRLHFDKPRQNPFMIGENKLVATEQRNNQALCLDSSSVSFKFYQHTDFNQPNGDSYISITDPNMYSSSKQIAIKRVWLACLNEYLQARFFDVELASLQFRVYPHHHGVSIHTSGLSEKQLLLAIELVNNIKQFRANKAQIKRHIQQCAIRFRHQQQQSPFNQLFAKLNEYYQAPHKKSSQVLDSLSSLSVDDVHDAQRAFFTHNFIESLLVGNFSVVVAKRFFAQLNSRFTAFISNTSKYNSERKIVKPQANYGDVKSSEHIHLCTPKLSEQHIILHFIPKLSNNCSKLDLAAKSLLLEKLLSPMMFDVLRKKYNMGYMIGAGYKPIGGHPGVVLYALSHTHTLDDIMLAVREAIRDAIEAVVAQPKIVAHLSNELVKQVIPKEKDVSQIAQRAWLHFDDDEPLRAYEDLIIAIETLQSTHVIECLQQLLHTSIGQVLLSQSSEAISENQKEHVFSSFSSNN
ncbi:MAG: insulinase family protein [Glaciecola sp.]